VLGALRYQPQPLELPAGVRPERQRRLLPGLAIAATIALMVLGATLWLRFHRSQTPVNNVIAIGSPVEKKQNAPSPALSPNPKAMDQQAFDTKRKAEQNNRQRKATTTGSMLAKKANRPRVVPIHNDEGARIRSEEAEAVAAKGQLMLALRLASAKLNLAQRKTQGSPAPGTIRNQHKIG
jgi:hypothetical protein